jgi:hypothetical protein
LWIDEIKKLGFYNDNLVPFRFFDKIVRKYSGDREAHWVSWFLNNRNELQEFEIASSLEEIDISSPIGFCNTDPELENNFNNREVNEYRERIKSVSIESLRNQQKLWENLHIKSPLRTKSGNLILVYMPIPTIKDEIQKRLVDAVVSKTKSSHQKNSFNKKTKLWAKNKSEFCLFIREEYNNNKDNCSSLRDFAFDLFDKFSFKDKSWTKKKCYNLLMKKQ